MIKLQDVLPSGLKLEWYGGNGDMRHYSYPFNAVDYDGIGCKCPDWLEFEVIKLSSFAGGSSNV